MKTNRIFKVDASLVPAFIGTAATGIGLHLAGHDGSHEAWHAWAVAHVLFSLVFTALIWNHVKQHLGWYKNLRRPSKRLRAVTTALSLVMLAEVMTGAVLLLCVDGEGSRWGHVHWAGGVILAILATGHILKRLKTLLRGLGLS